MQQGKDEDEASDHHNKREDEGYAHDKDIVEHLNKYGLDGLGSGRNTYSLARREAPNGCALQIRRKNGMASNSKEEALRQGADWRQDPGKDQHHSGVLAVRVMGYGEHDGKQPISEQT